MRASFQKDLNIQENYQIKGDAAHHLISVVRVELNEEILLLNGKGLMVKTKVADLSKRELQLKKLEDKQVPLSRSMDLALGIPKKEALELSLKQAVELGFSKIYLIRSQYSQTRLPEADRIEALLVSALEQSNAAYLPEIVSLTWEDLPVSDYSDVLMLDSQTKTDGLSLSGKGCVLLVVGPEGGFAPEESKLIHSWPNSRIVNLPTPILRTPTAVAAGAGIVLGSLLD